MWQSLGRPEPTLKPGTFSQFPWGAPGAERTRSSRRSPGVLREQQEPVTVQGTQTSEGPVKGPCRPCLGPRLLGPETLHARPSRVTPGFLPPAGGRSGLSPGYDECGRGELAVQGHLWESGRDPLDSP